MDVIIETVSFSVDDCFIVPSSSHLAETGKLIQLFECDKKGDLFIFKQRLITTFES